MPLVRYSHSVDGVAKYEEIADPAAIADHRARRLAEIRDTPHTYHYVDYDHDQPAVYEIRAASRAEAAARVESLAGDHGCVRLLEPGDEVQRRYSICGYARFRAIRDGEDGTRLLRVPAE